MAKNIIFFADGTWNHPNETEHGLPADTNVVKMWRAGSGSAGQITHYDDGVGADGTPLDRLLGGAIGEGLFSKVRDGYACIASMYRPGDRLYLFGFSRGAYTARSLAGMIAICGLPDQDRVSDQAVRDAFDAYRAGIDRAPFLEALNGKYGNMTTTIEIAMVGVWDTVGALGIPGSLFQGLDATKYGFLDTTLHPDVKAAYHALSIDERRPAFDPTLWQPNGKSLLEQVWFAGVHADIGGGYAEAGLSDIALSWMMKQARGHGVRFDAGAYDRYTAAEPKHSLDALHRSWSPLWGFPKSRIVPPDAVLANSVSLRVQALPDYRPRNLLLSNGALQSSYRIAAVV